MNQQAAYRTVGASLSLIIRSSYPSQDGYRGKPSAPDHNMISNMFFILKRISLIFVVTALALSTLQGQNVSISNDGSPPDSSAMLDVKSSTQGLLIPRMTSTQRQAIVNPASGLLVFQMDTPSGLWFFDGTRWMVGSVFTLVGDTISNGNGNYATNDFVVGAPSLNYDGNTDHAARMFFDKTKGAFRAGFTDNLKWDADSSGTYSFASGFSAKASGDYATASGYKTTASGTAATALGSRSIASGINSTAMGNFARASGYKSTAMGDSTTSTGSLATSMGSHSSASGEISTAMGLNTTANGFASLVVGMYNDPIVSPQFYPTDESPLFIVGNGDAGNPGNAMVVRKDGNVGIGTKAPVNQLHVKDSVGEGEYAMLIENADPSGSGLKIRIGGSHPTWFPDSNSYVNFRNVVDDEEFIWLDDFYEAEARIGIRIADSYTGFNMYDALFDPYTLAGMGLDTFAATLGCAGYQYLIQKVSSFIPDSLTIDVSDTIDLGAALGYSITLPNLPNLNSSFPNVPTIPLITYSGVGSQFVDPINNAFGSFNSGVGNFNTTAENRYDAIVTGFGTLDNAMIPFEPPIWEYEWNRTIPLLGLLEPDSLGAYGCPDPNPFVDGSISFGFIDFLCSDNRPTGPDSLYSINEFITFVDKEDRKLGAIKALSLCEGYLDYWDFAKTLKLIPTDISGLATAFGTYAGSLENIRHIGVSYESGHGDYAEWLERTDHNERIGPSDIIGIKGGKISRNLNGAEQVMVVSKAPIVLGNTPPEDRKKDGNNVAFIGQVPVKVMGLVRSGDYISGNPETPGYGIAISPDEIDKYDFTLVVGRSWDTNETPGFKFVNTIVGMHNNAWAKPMMALQDRTEGLEARLEANEQTVQALIEKVDGLSQAVNH